MLLQALVGDYADETLNAVGERLHLDLFFRRDHRIIADIVLDLNERGFVPEWSLVAAEKNRRDEMWDKRATRTNVCLIPLIIE